MSLNDHILSTDIQAMHTDFDSDSSSLFESELGSKQQSPCFSPITSDVEHASPFKKQWNAKIAALQSTCEPFHTVLNQESEKTTIEPFDDQQTDADAELTTKAQTSDLLSEEDLEVTIPSSIVEPNEEIDTFMANEVDPFLPEPTNAIQDPFVEVPKETATKQDASATMICGSNILCGYHPSPSLAPQLAEEIRTCLRDAAVATLKAKEKELAASDENKVSVLFTLASVPL